MTLIKKMCMACIYLSRRLEGWAPGNLRHHKLFFMPNKDTLVTIGAFILSIFGVFALIAKLGASVIRTLLIKLYDLLFRHNVKNL